MTTPALPRLEAPPGRAVEPGQKRAVMERILAAWLAVPELRLGQMLCNAWDEDLFYAEDKHLARDVMKYAADATRASRPTTPTEKRTG